MPSEPAPIDPATEPGPREPAWSPAVYDELRRVADAVMAGERAGHTLEPTALTHEVWLRLLQSRNAAALDRQAFLGLAAQAMRRILTDHARRRSASKRGGRMRRTTMAGRVVEDDPGEIALDLDEALSGLEALDPELARLVELRFYGGLSTEEIADALETSPRTIKRRWQFARAWLRNAIQELES